VQFDAQPLHLRKEAAAALDEIANADAEPFLAPLANDPDPEVRKNSH
jgi:HEAT repeat protein